MRAPFKRALGDENDKVLFFAAFLGGIISILVVRIIGDYLSAQPGISAFDFGAILIAVGIIFLYTTVILVSKNRSGISVDRASDNVYYLGLLFTLTSLAYSLTKMVTFTGSGIGSARDVIYLLPDFGVALASTIAGIFGRVWLQQMRNDPLDVETEAREELGIAVRQLRETIGQIVSNLNSLSTQTNVTLTELNNNISRTLEATATQNSDVLAAVASDVGQLSEKLRAQVDQVTDFSRITTENFNQILDEIKGQFQGLETIPASLEANFNALAAKVSDVSSSISETASQQKELSQELTTSVVALRDAFSAEMLKNIANSMDEADQSLRRMSDNLAGREKTFNDSNAQFEDSLELLGQSVKSVQSYAGRIESSAKSVDEANTEYVEELSKAAETLRKETESN